MQIMKYINSKRIKRISRNLKGINNQIDQILSYANPQNNLYHWMV